MEAFAQNVKRLIERERGQTALASAIGVNQSTISKWKNGGAIKDMAPVIRMAELAGVSVHHLLNEPISAQVEEKPASVVTVSLPVVLPTVDALRAMFSTMLVGMENQHLDEIARRLAEGLPRGLASALSGQPTRRSDELTSHAEPPQSLAIHQPKAQ
jgi:transcriptional regulator with XRE-family HTH domain